MSLTFEESTHTYFWDGGRVPSVTQVLESAGIVDYSGMPRHLRDQALARGRRVHLATCFDDEFVTGICREPLDEASVSEIDRPYVAAYRHFRESTGFRPELIEHRGYHRQYRYAGTLDRTGRFPNRPSTPVMLDLKTGTAERWVQIQTAGYAAMHENPRMFTRFCVELHEDGSYELKHHRDGRHFQEDFNLFLYALAIFNFKEGK